MTLQEFLAQHVKPYDAQTDDYERAPFAFPVKAGKNTAIYNAHSYHTKVPPQGIEPYIRHYTEPGELLLDPFCGSGMTGVTALKLGRAVILNDLSPAACHIAYNYCTPVDVAALKREFERIKETVKEEFDWLYGTTCDCGAMATIQYTIWSDVFACSTCNTEIVLWDAAVDHDTGKVNEMFRCPNRACRREWRKRDLTRLRSIPVLTNFYCPRCKRREHPTTEAERQHIAEIEAREIPYWYPTDEFPHGRQTRKLKNGAQRISRVDEMFTRRNLWALAQLWNEFDNVQDERTRSMLRFAVTSVCNYINRRQSWGGGGGGVSGTLYVGSLVLEKNVIEVISRKIEKLAESFPQHLPNLNGKLFLRVGSAGGLADISNDSVDYIFTDPPFGESLQYAELNFLWEAWLRQFTPIEEDCVMNYVHHKDLAFYHSKMSVAFREMYRVLKPNRWASVVFHNTDDNVWQAIRQAAEEVGFELANAMMFDKEQKSFNAVTSTGAANYDVVLNLHKRGQVRQQQPNAQWDVPVLQAITQHLSSRPAPDYRTMQYLHSLAVRTALNVNAAVEGLTMPYLKRLLREEAFKEVDGRWYLLNEAVEGELGLDIRDETSAIGWLRAQLAQRSRTRGELDPDWKIATLAVRLNKNLDQILEENFWRDAVTHKWRIPSPEEQAHISDSETLRTRRRVRRFLERGRVDGVDDKTLCEWIAFCYREEMFAEAVDLFPLINDTQVDADIYRATEDVVKICRKRLRELSEAEQSKPARRSKKTSRNGGTNLGLFD